MKPETVETLIDQPSKAKTAGWGITEGTATGATESNRTAAAMMGIRRPVDPRAAVEEQVVAVGSLPLEERRCFGSSACRRRSGIQPPHAPKETAAGATAAPFVADQRC